MSVQNLYVSVHGSAASNDGPLEEAARDQVAGVPRLLPLPGVKREAQPG